MRTRNLALFGVLLSLAILFFIMTIVRIGAGH
jgi:hypothetical protein